MSISSISSGSGVIPTPRPQLESNEAVQGGRDVKNDGDSDDGNGGPAPVAPTTNSQGQTIGTIINATA